MAAALTAPARPAAGEAALSPELSDPARPGTILLGLDGNASVIRIAPYLWEGGEAGHPCATVHVTAHFPAAEVEISTIGLGEAHLAVVHGTTKACAEGTAPDGPPRLLLTAAGAAAQEWLVAVRPDATALAAPGMAMDGQIVAAAPPVGMVAVPLKIERRPMSEWLTALLWAMGVGAPALLGYWLGRKADAVNHRQKLRDDEAARLVTEANEERKRRRDQAEAFAAWRQEAPAQQAVQVVLDELDSLIRAGTEDPCARLLGMMHRLNMLAKMPSDDRQTLIDVCRQDQRDETERRNEFLMLLRRLFPERQAEIRTAWN